MPWISLSTRSAGRRSMDPRDKPEDDGLEGAAGESLPTPTRHGRAWPDHPSVCSGVRGEMDPRDKPEDDLLVGQAVMPLGELRTDLLLEYVVANQVRIALGGIAEAAATGLLVHDQGSV